MGVDIEIVPSRADKTCISGRIGIFKVILRFSGQIWVFRELEFVMLGIFTIGSTNATIWCINHARKCLLTNFSPGRVFCSIWPKNSKSIRVWKTQKMALLGLILDIFGNVGQFKPPNLSQICHFVKKYALWVCLRYACHKCVILQARIKPKIDPDVARTPFCY